MDLMATILILIFIERRERLREKGGDENEEEGGDEREFGG